MERGIRHTKTELLGYKTAIENCENEKAREKLQGKYDRLVSQLSLQNKAYNEFCKTNDLKRRSDRLQAAKWGRSEASEAVTTAQQLEAFRSKILSAEKTSTGITITEVSPHVFTRARFRELSAEQVTDALTNPLALGKIREDRSQQFIGEFATVPINVDTGKVSTCWPTSSQKAKKLKEKR